MFLQLKAILRFISVSQTAIEAFAHGCLYLVCSFFTGDGNDLFYLTREGLMENVTG